MKSHTLVLRSVRSLLISALALCGLVTSPATAGTTGGLSGVVINAANRQPIADARVTATSPSQMGSAVTDASGHFTFASLAPDQYTVSAEKQGFDPVSISGNAVFADSVQTVTLTMRQTLKVIGRVSSRATSDLVRPGTTADVYSVNANQQERASALGGGGNLNSAFSAVATVPGAYVPTNQGGYLQAVHVRGGDSYEVGYEFDGIPVNRGFDNYPSGSLSSLGQLELQVYTGATPANAEAQGLAGFINQVIRTGTYPGFGEINAALGAPTFYHSLNFEAGGATSNRLFSYYVGIGGYNQDHRYVDQYGGASYANELGPILDGCPSPAPPSLPSCFTNGQPNVGLPGTLGANGYILGPLGFGGDVANIATRTAVVNVHFGIPHKRDRGRDDIQLLYDNDTIFSALMSSALDEGITNFNGTTYGPGVLPYYTDSFQYTGPMGTFLPANASSLVQPYYFPSSPQNRPAGAAIPLAQRDIQYNNQNIFKLQYQKNFSSDAFLRLYGYTYYSDYVASGALSSWQPYTGLDSGDYELNSHTRGLSASFTKQFGPKHLVELQGSYTTSKSLRLYSQQPFGKADKFAVLVNPNDLTSGTCYALPTDANGNPLPSGAASPTTCNTGAVLPVGSSATFASLASIGAGTRLPNASQYTCGGNACNFFAIENGAYGSHNNVKPIFTGYSFTDHYRPNDRLLLNLGVRLDRYVFQGENTTASPARAFAFNAFNNDTCFNAQTLQLADKTTLLNASGNPLSISDACSAAGAQYQPAALQNTPSQQFTYTIVQPRAGVSYTLSPDTVLRASFGKYNEQPSAAYEQYNSLQQNLPNTLIPFYSLGFNTPGHEVRPSVSYNSDFSLERHIKGTDLSFKLTPFYRRTQDETESFYTDIKSGFIAGLNAGSQTSSGFELALNKGDFERNGLAGQLSFAYTNSYVKYTRLPNGTTILSPINADIQHYNAYTAYCSAHGSSNAADPCYTGIGTAANTTNHLPAAACYTPAGTPDPLCAAGDIANPYWNAQPAGLLDPGGKYLPYSTIPGGVGSGANAYNYPYVATLLLNYKHDKWNITPSLQFVAGNRYGAPETMPGIDPAAGCSPLAAPPTTDPRYQYGFPAGTGTSYSYDATSCAGLLGTIPNSFTGQFDAIGAFRQPSQLAGHMRISYEASKKVSLSLTMANLISTCFGGQQTSFTYLSNKNVCSYGGLLGAASPVGNVYNPGANVQTFLRYPYEPSFGTYNDIGSSILQPFSAYLSVRIKL